MKRQSVIAWLIWSQRTTQSSSPPVLQELCFTLLQMFFGQLRFREKDAAMKWKALYSLLNYRNTSYILKQTWKNYEKHFRMMPVKKLTCCQCDLFSLEHFKQLDVSEKKTWRILKSFSFACSAASLPSSSYSRHITFGKTVQDLSWEEISHHGCRTSWRQCGDMTI